jgi:rubrerythrin
MLCKYYYILEIETARDEGFPEIASWFETLAKAEKSHAGRFQKALESMPKAGKITSSCM